MGKNVKARKETHHWEPLRTQKSSKSSTTSPSKVAENKIGIKKILPFLSSH